MNDGGGGEGRGKQEEVKTRWQIGLTCRRKIIENSSNVLGITRGGAKQEVLAPQKRVENSVQPEMWLDVGALIWDHHYCLNTCKPRKKLPNRSSQEFQKVWWT